MARACGVELPELDALLHNRTINNVIQAYLGPATMQCYKITRLSTQEENDVQAYTSGRWHHDRAGSAVPALGQDRARVGHHRS